MVLNRYPWWKNALIMIILLIAFIYAMPILFGDSPAVQISGTNGIATNQQTVTTIQQLLQNAHLPFSAIHKQDQSILILFPSEDIQLKGKETIEAGLGSNYSVALNLAPKTPHWLMAIGAMPMKLGLDLRGGVHLLMEVDVDSVIKQRIEGDLSSMAQLLRSNHVRYSGLARNNDSIELQFPNHEALDQALRILQQHFSEFIWKKGPDNLQGTLSPLAIQELHKDTLEQEMNILRNRVNELGVSEAVVQQQGLSRVVVDLPGIQDTAQAKKILGETSTLEFHMVDTQNDSRSAAASGMVPSGTKLYYNDKQGPVLLKNQVILRGPAITSARSGVGEDGRSEVDVRLGGGGEGLFTRTTAENVGKPMAVLNIKVKPITTLEKGKKVIHYQTEYRVISEATILQALGNSFQITGLANQEEARTLALLLRAGALPTSVAVIEERQIGPTLGKQNIRSGLLSVSVGFILVVTFMAIYYRTFGLIADIALAMNLILIVAILSLLGATLTLPGIAGIVLTVGMAADANVLIFERIREELRNGNSIQASIHAGYDRALVTIVDANITTLIVAIVLFSLGSGVVKNFAVTVTIGLLTSMFTAIMGTRALVNAIYGGKPVRKISIGA